jgi:hypothetical protein
MVFAGDRPNLRFSHENALIMTGLSRIVNHGSFKSFNGLGRYQSRELHKHSLRGSQLARSTPPPARHRINVARRPGLDGYLSDFWEYPFQTHSMACGRNCCWALLTLCRAPRQNKY